MPAFKVQLGKIYSPQNRRNVYGVGLSQALNNRAENDKEIPDKSLFAGFMLSLRKKKLSISGVLDVKQLIQLIGRGQIGEY